LVPVHSRVLKVELRENPENWRAERFERTVPLVDRLSANLSEGKNQIYELFYLIV
jgi:hypothetical protein